MRVLLIKTSSMGDLIHSFPALTDAARAIPGLRVDWVVEEGFAEIPAWHPVVDKTISVAIRRWRKQPLRTLFSEEWKRFKACLRAEPYDLVIDAQGLLKSAWLTRYVSAPVAGFGKKYAREPLASHFYDRTYSVPRNQHAVERVRQLFAQALGYELPAGIGDYGLDKSRFHQTELKSPYLLFLHGTTWPSKHWPESYWRALAEQLSAEGWTVRLPWGNDREHERALRIAEGLPRVSLLPRLNLAGVAEVIAGASACVAVDTGLGHLAAALDIPTVSLYGPTLPLKVGAYGRDQVHLCATGLNAGSGDRQAQCMDSLVPAQVMDALRPLLSSRGVNA